MVVAICLPTEIYEQRAQGVPLTGRFSYLLGSIRAPIPAGSHVLWRGCCSGPFREILHIKKLLNEKKKWQINLPYCPSNDLKCPLCSMFKTEHQCWLFVTVFRRLLPWRLQRLRGCQLAQPRAGWQLIKMSDKCVKRTNNTLGTGSRSWNCSKVPPPQSVCCSLSCVCQFFSLTNLERSESVKGYLFLLIKNICLFEKKKIY